MLFATWIPTVFVKKQKIDKNLVKKTKSRFFTKFMTF